MPGESNDLKSQKYYLVVNLVKQEPCERLITRLKDGRSISKEQVIKESMVSSKRYIRTELTKGRSGQPGKGYRHRSYVNNHVTEMSAFDPQDGHTMSVNNMYPQPVL